MKTVNIFTRLSLQAGILVVIWLVLAVVIGYIILSKKIENSDDFMESPVSVKKKK